VATTCSLLVLGNNYQRYEYHATQPFEFVCLGSALLQFEEETNVGSSQVRAFGVPSVVICCALARLLLDLIPRCPRKTENEGGTC
jgi:hypothetical protein